MAGQRGAAARFVRQSRTQSRMWSFTVVVANPLRQDPPQMPLVERNHPVETLAPSGANHAFAMRVGLRGANWRLQHAQRHRSQRIVDGWREDAIAIVHEQARSSIEREAIAKLLHRPLGCGMPREIPVDDPPGRDVEDDEHVDALKRGGHHHEEVAGHHGAGVTAKKCRPRLRPPAAGARPRPTRHVAANRSRRHGEAEFQPELRRDPLLTPRAIRVRHLGDEPPEFGWNPGTTAWT